MLDFNNFDWLEKYIALSKIVMHFTILGVFYKNVGYLKLHMENWLGVFTTTLNAVGHSKGKTSELSDMTLCLIVQNLGKF